MRLQSFAQKDLCRCRFSGEVIQSSHVQGIRPHQNFRDQIVNVVTDLASRIGQTREWLGVLGLAVAAPVALDFQAYEDTQPLRVVESRDLCP